MTETNSERVEDWFYHDYDSDSAKSKEELMNGALDGLIDMGTEIQSHSTYMEHNLQTDAAVASTDTVSNQLTTSGNGMSSRRSDDRSTPKLTLLTPPIQKVGPIGNRD